MASLSIGRSRSCSIVVDAPSVSRHHADLTVVSHDRFRFEDHGSTAGSYRIEDGTWRKFTSAELNRYERVRLGEFECSLDELLGRAKRPEHEPENTPEGEKAPRTVIERDPTTGQIVVRRL